MSKGTTIVEGDSTTTNNLSNGSLGIKGLVWNNVGNMAAMAIIAGAFLYLGQVYVNQSKEDRTMFREELKAIRSSQDDRWEKTDITHGKAMERMGATVEKAVVNMERAVKVLEDHSRRVGVKPDGGGGGP